MSKPFWYKKGSLDNRKAQKGRGLPDGGQHDADDGATGPNAGSASNLSSAAAAAARASIAGSNWETCLSRQIC